MTDTLISSPVLTSLALTLLHFLWQGVLIAVVLKSVLIALPQNKSQARYLFSCGALVTSLIAPVITFSLLYQPAVLNQQLIEFTGVLNSLPSKLNLHADEGFFNSILPWLAISWMVCVAYLSVKLILDFLGVLHLKTRHVIVPTPGMAERFEGLVEQLKIKSNPKLLISLKAGVPMAVGWIKPVVLIPAQMLTGLDEDQLDMILLHELAHIKRYDYLVNLVQSVIELLLFFHPCVKWISKQIRIEREFCSDDIAIEHCGNPIAYAHTLTDTATICRHSIPNMAMAASGGDLKQRVVRIVNHHCTTAKNNGSFYAAAFVVLVLMSTVVNQIVNSKVIDITAASIQFFNPAVVDGETLEIAKEQIKPIHIDEMPSSLDNENEKALIADNKNTQKAFDKTLTNESQNLDAVLESKTEAKSKAVTIARVKVPRVSPIQAIQPETAAEQIETTSAQDSVNETIVRVANQTSEKISNADIFTASDVSTDATVEVAMSQTTDLPITENQVAQVEAQPLLTNEGKNDTSIKAEISAELLADLITPMNFYDDIEPSKDLVASDKKTRAAQVIKSYQPKYPEIAKRKGLETDIRVSFVVDKDGRVKDMNFDSFRKHVYFRRAVKNAVKKWRFKPATKNGQPVESTVSKIFSFNLIS